MFSKKGPSLLWAKTPQKLRAVILHDIDGQKPYRDRSKGPNYFSEYVSEKYGVCIDPNVLRARLSEFRKGYIEAPDAHRLTDFLRLKGDWIVTTDWQVPYHDSTLVMAMVHVAKMHGIKNIVLGGDFLDNILYSKFLPRVEGTTSEQQFEVAERILEMLLDEFDKVVWMRANHEARFFSRLDNKLGMERFAHLISSSVGDKLITTEYPYLHINEHWRLTHPLNFSIIPMRIAFQMAAKYRMSILCAHGHRFGLSFDHSGQDLVVDTGGLFDITKLEYIMLSDSVNPVMNQGFVVIDNNFPYLYGPMVTDWKKIGFQYDTPAWISSLRGGGANAETTDTGS
jgi:hypothetical protein